MAGNIKIIEPKDNFRKVSKDIIFNEDVDALTLGIYVKVLCLGKKWDMNIKGLAFALHLSADRIRKAFVILENAGFLRRSKTQASNGRFTGWDYEISSVPLTDIAKTPTSGKTDIGENRRSENDAQNKDNNINRDIYKENRDIEYNTTPEPKFNFKNSLLELGVSDEVADAFMAVRRKKRATNSKIAFDGLVREIRKSGKSAEYCIRKAAEHSWSGFEAAWIMENKAAPAPRQKESVFEHNLRVMDQMFGTNNHEKYYGKKEVEIDEQ